ncbi:MAG: hypothetical protein KJ048_07275 [Dehalococcoidia bacterium]|nr:hypothetical protein [Dehalococcoidia bacterium]
MTVRDPGARMKVVVNGKQIELSAEDSAQRKRLLREATAAVVALYRPALERLEDA